MVAPRAGAWIETLVGTLVFRVGEWSLPARERGLKPYMDWQSPFQYKSLPARERGLKLVCLLIYLLCALSLPARERGLKPGKNCELLIIPGGRSPRGSVD